VYKTICDILQKEEDDDDDEVTYHAASIQLMEAYLWKGILAQHILYLFGGLSIVPARFCANSETWIGTDAYKNVKGLLPLASLNKCLHDLAKEQKVAPMVVNASIVTITVTRVMLTYYLMQRYMTSKFL
jgi:hypothetical protein